MPPGRACSICVDPAKRDAVDRLLAKGDGYRPIARRLAHFGISKDVVQRHARHTAKLLTRSPEKVELAADALREKFVRTTEGLINDLERLREKAEASRDVRGAAKIIESTFRGLELLAKFWGLLNERTPHQTLHVHLTPERARAVAETFLARHGATAPTAQLEGELATGTDTDPHPDPDAPD